MFEGGSLKSSPKLLYSLGLISGLITLVQIICIFLPYWMHIDSQQTIGLFHSVHEDNSKIFETNCTDDMGELECGYVHSFQIAGVIAVMFGGITTLLYFLATSYSTDLVAFLAVSGTLIQSMFGLIVFVLFLYFKQNYFDDDGVNQEYDDVPGEENTHLLGTYWVWVSFNSLNWLATFAGYYFLYLSGYQKRGLLTV